MTSAEDQLRTLKQRAEQKRSEFHTVAARAAAQKEVYDRSLSQLTERFGVSTIEQAEEMIEASEAQITDRLAQLEAKLR